MKTYKVVHIRKIAEDSKGNPLNIVVLDIPNRPSIVRSAKEFLTDLNNSFLIGDKVKNINHPDVLDVFKDLSAMPFTVTGTIVDAKKGQKWTVTENSRVVTDKNHPLYGEVEAGDELPYEKDMTLVTEGFLKVAVNPVIRYENKKVLATAMQEMLDSANAMDNAFEEEEEQAPENYGAEPVFADVPTSVVTDATEPVIE